MTGIDLPAPADDGVTLHSALASRRTCRRFSPDSVSLDDVSGLLWAAQGITGPRGERAAPSAGGRHPLQLVVAIGAVAGIDPALYRYEVGGHRLHVFEAGDHRWALHDAAFDEQPWVRDAAVVVVIAGDMASLDEHFRSQAPVGTRGRRYAAMETGAVAQNVHLRATALGLGMVLVGGFDDGAVTDAVHLGRLGLEPAALLAIGVPEEG